MGDLNYPIRFEALGFAEFEAALKSISEALARVDYVPEPLHPVLGEGFDATYAGARLVHNATSVETGEGGTVIRSELLPGPGLALMVVATLEACGAHMVDLRWSAAGWPAVAFDGPEVRE